MKVMLENQCVLVQKAYGSISKTHVFFDTRKTLPAEFPAFKAVRGHDAVRRRVHRLSLYPHDLQILPSNHPAFTRLPSILLKCHTQKSRCKIEISRLKTAAQPLSAARSGRRSPGWFCGTLSRNFQAYRLLSTHSRSAKKSQRLVTDSLI